MNVDEALDRVESRYQPIDAPHVLATEVRKLRAVLDGTAPAEGSWRTEALALRAELTRLRVETTNARAELERLWPIERAAWAVRDSQPEDSLKHQIAQIILGEAQ